MTNKLPVALYQLTGEYLQAAERMADMDLPAEAIRDTLEGLLGPVEEKSVAVAAMARNWEGLAAQMKAAEKAIAERRAALEKRAEQLRIYLKDNMDKLKITEISCPEFALKIKKNPPAVDVVDAALIPDAYKRIPPMPLPQADLTAIKDALKEGKDVPGCRLKQDTRLEIK